MPNTTTRYPLSLSLPEMAAMRFAVTPHARLQICEGNVDVALSNSW